MTKEELIERLEALQQDGDTEYQHGEADDLLIEWINDPEVTEAYAKIKKWYA